MEAAARERALRSEAVAVRQAGGIARAVQAAALNPDGGWWRKRARGQGEALRWAAVMEAISLGCAVGEISLASGASSRQVYSALDCARKHGGVDPKVRRWGAILGAAAARALTIADIAKQQRVTPGWAMKACHRLGFPLRKRPNKSSFILPRNIP